MKTIHKYPLTEKKTELELPEGSTVVCVHEQHGVPTLWIEMNLNVNAPMKKTTFEIVGTGRLLKHGNEQYIGTAFIDEFVWHVYQMIDIQDVIKDISNIDF